MVDSMACASMKNPRPKAIPRVVRRRASHTTAATASTQPNTAGRVLNGCSKLVDSS